MIARPSKLRHTLTLFALLIFGGMNVCAQYTVDPATKELYMAVDQSSYTDMKFKITNTGTTDLDFSYTLISSNIDTTGGLWTVQFCGPGNCVPWLPAYGTSDMTIPPGGSNLFKLTLEPGNPVGPGWATYEIQPMGSSVRDTLHWEWDISIGIDDAAFAPNVQIFPNPANNQLNLKNTAGNWQEGTAKLIDLQGRTLESKSLSGQSELVWNLENMPTGMYIMRLQTETGNYSRTFIRE